jgi:hypothetical protein
MEIWRRRSQGFRANDVHPLISISDRSMKLPPARSCRSPAGGQGLGSGRSSVFAAQASPPREDHRRRSARPNHQVGSGRRPHGFGTPTGSTCSTLPASTPSSFANSSSPSERLTFPPRPIKPERTMDARAAANYDDGMMALAAAAGGPPLRVAGPTARRLRQGRHRSPGPIVARSAGRLHPHAAARRSVDRVSDLRSSPPRLPSAPRS